MFDFVMPSLGADMETGTLVGWIKQPGDAVRRGDVIAEVETDKGIIEIEVYKDGVIDEVLVQPGKKVPVGSVLARIREAGDVQGTAAAAQIVQPAAEELSGAEEKRPLTPAVEPQRGRVSPAARQLAHELHVELNSVHGSGAEGVITRDDVLRAAKKIAETKPVSGESVTETAESATNRARRMRHSIATAMTRSKKEIPHYYLSTTIDMQRSVDWLSNVNATCPVAERLLMPVLLLKATAVALRQFPELNATWETDRVRIVEDIHIGVAIALRQGGLIAPAIHHSDKLSLPEMMQRLRELTDRARSGRLRGSELSDATITVTNLGDRGVEAVFGIIYPPQVALVGFGKIVERPWSIAGKILPRQVVTATLSADHRVSDGHRGGLFLSAIDRILQEPEKL